MTPRGNSQPNPSRVLVIFPGALGDLICAEPAIRALRRRYGDAALELMARSDLAAFAVGRMAVASGHSIDRREMTAMFTSGAAANPAAREFFGRFERIHSFFAANDPQFRAALITAAGGEVSFHPFRPEGEGHIAGLYLRSAGFDDESATPLIELSASDLDSARDVLESARIEPHRFVLIMPGSGSPRKNWPADRFANLARRLPAPFRALVVLGPAESGLERVFAGFDIAVVSNLRLETVAGLARLAAAFVGNDSGVSHVAAASGGRGVAIFGPTDPHRWGPIGAVTIVRREPLAAVTEDDVFSALVAALP